MQINVSDGLGSLLILAPAEINALRDHFELRMSHYFIYENVNGKGIDEIVHGMFNLRFRMSCREVAGGVDMLIWVGDYDFVFNDTKTEIMVDDGSD